LVYDDRHFFAARWVFVLFFSISLTALTLRFMLVDRHKLGPSFTQRLVAGNGATQGPLALAPVSHLFLTP